MWTQQSWSYWSWLTHWRHHAPRTSLGLFPIFLTANSAKCARGGPLFANYWLPCCPMLVRCYGSCMKYSLHSVVYINHFSFISSLRLLPPKHGVYIALFRKFSSVVNAKSNRIIWVTAGCTSTCTSKILLLSCSHQGFSDLTFFVFAGCFCGKNLHTKDGHG